MRSLPCLAIVFSPIKGPRQLRWSTSLYDPSRRTENIINIYVGVWMAGCTLGTASDGACASFFFERTWSWQRATTRRAKTRKKRKLRLLSRVQRRPARRNDVRTEHGVDVAHIVLCVGGSQLSEFAASGRGCRVRDGLFRTSISASSRPVSLASSWPNGSRFSAIGARSAFSKQTRSAIFQLAGRVGA